MSTWRTPPAPIPEEQISRRYETDVVVIGLGYSGSAALRAAAEAGARCVGVEIMKEDTFASFGRDIGHINSKFLASRGIPSVDPLDLFNEIMQRALNRANPELIMKFAQNSGDAFDWFTDMFGVEGLEQVHVAFWPDASQSFDGEQGGFRFWRGTAQFPEPRGWKGHPSLSELCLANHKKARDAGADILYQTEALQLTKEDGRVTGLIAKHRDGDILQICAAKGVILAAGDFSSNPEMLSELCSGLSDLLEEGERLPRGIGRNGRGIQLGVWAGGRLEAGPLATMDGDHFTLHCVTGLNGVLWLDPTGKRYCNEAFGDPVFIGFPGAEMARGTYYHVFDEGIMDTLQWSPPAHGNFDRADPVQVRVLEEGMAGAREAGPGGSRNIGRTMVLSGREKSVIYAGNTLEELADNIGFEGKLREAFFASVARYNELCRGGRDEDFGKQSKLLIPLDKPPFYIQTYVHDGPGPTYATVGGLLTDANQNVLDMKHQTIPGLYATGNCCGRRFGYHYSTPISGLSIGMAITLGREAGKVAAT